MMELEKILKTRLGTGPGWEEEYLSYKRELADLELAKANRIMLRATGARWVRDLASIFLKKEGEEPNHVSDDTRPLPQTPSGFLKSPACTSNGFIVAILRLPPGPDGLGWTGVTEDPGIFQGQVGGTILRGGTTRPAQENEQGQVSSFGWPDIGINLWSLLTLLTFPRS